MIPDMGSQALETFIQHDIFIIAQLVLSVKNGRRVESLNYLSWVLLQIL